MNIDKTKVREALRTASMWIKVHWQLSLFFFLACYFLLVTHDWIVSLVLLAVGAFLESKREQEERSKKMSNEPMSKAEKVFTGLFGNKKKQDSNEQNNQPGQAKKDGPVVVEAEAVVIVKPKPDQKEQQINSQNGREKTMNSLIGKTGSNWGSNVSQAIGIKKNNEDERGLSRDDRLLIMAGRKKKQE